MFIRGLFMGCNPAIETLDLLKNMYKLEFLPVYLLVALGH